MEDTKLLSEKMWAVLKAALWGGGLSLLLMLVFTACGLIWGHGAGNDFWPRFFFGTSVLLDMAAMSLRIWLGLSVDNWLVNPYFVDAIIASVFSPIIALTWQFLIKAGYEQS